MSLIRLSKSIIGKSEAEAVSNVLLENGYLGMGSEVEVFEKEIASYLGVLHENVACVNTGTAALQLALQSVLNPGDEVLVQSLTYVATYQAITAAGMIPVSCEVDPETITINLEDAHKKLTSKTKAIMPVFYASSPGNLEAVYKFAHKYNLRIIEDAAQAFGCEYNGKKIGSNNDLTCFSFDGIKNITCGEGGCIVSSDKNAISQICDLRLLGVEKDTEKRFKQQRSWDFDVKKQGYRYHMSNINAAIGRIQLKRLDSEFAPIRKMLAALYRDRLSNLKELSLILCNLDSVIPHIMPIRVLNGKRDKIKFILEENKIQTGIHYKPNHQLSFYKIESLSLPVTDKLYNELLTLPLHPDLSEEDVNFICNIIIKNISS